ncbi:asparagine synthase (glutamine-hydrolyzing) [Candidatus Magnetomonas plexicatena]|uniref:asparagine synthase (glutamine-hydrolyzing) n=1 Tax=Candidatus Magnetomonas plexicatena TaxID=2552947 RepID=UPI0010FFFE2D|nr:asparagine synthase (glutamine-hydrolyzing) [Nitrospirales bacterium LBB_01]
MCGIAGFYGDFDRVLLDGMSRAIAHRGPDGSGDYFSKRHGVGLTHRRLSIIDLSKLGRQPMFDSSHSAVITYNGELYNYRELQQELLQAGVTFKSASDTEVVLNMYMRYGTDMLKRLNGIFAFAIWDIKKHMLFLSRDHLGVKPLYYSSAAKGFLFASELKALLHYDGLDKTLDYDGIHNYLSFLWSPSPTTMLKSVSKLAAGHAMVVKDGRIDALWQFYQLPYDSSNEKLSVSDAAERVHDSIETAVKRQMVSDVEVGAFLSGGLDSSAVVSFAKKHTDKLKCFTIGFNDASMRDEGFSDDLPYAKKAAAHLGVELHTVQATPEMAHKLTKMIYHLDEPQADMAALNVLAIAELARENGIKVLLSGAGGDDIFTGYSRHFALLLDTFAFNMPKQVRTLAERFSEAVPNSTTIGRRISRFLRFFGKDMNERIAGYFSWPETKQQFKLYSPDMTEALSDTSRLNPLLDALTKLPDTLDPINKMLFLDSKYFLTDHNLNYTDKMAMAAGVEVRVPLIDIDVVSAGFSIPVKYKQNGRTGKWIFKKAMERHLPKEIIYRPKTGFGVPLRRWLKLELRPLVDDVLSAESIKNRGIFNPKEVQLLISLDRSNKLDGAYTIFSLLCIELWCRTFVDTNTSQT